jgi:hypothetical protein
MQQAAYTRTYTKNKPPLGFSYSDDHACIEVLPNLKIPQSRALQRWQAFYYVYSLAQGKSDIPKRITFQ